MCSEMGKHILKHTIEVINSSKQDLSPGIFYFWPLFILCLYDMLQALSENTEKEGMTCNKSHQLELKWERSSLKLLSRLLDVLKHKMSQRASTQAR